MRLHVLVGGQLFWKDDPGPFSAMLAPLHEAVQRFRKDLDISTRGWQRSLVAARNTLITADAGPSVF